ncbi:MAG: signal peptidase I [Dietzia sp.]
MWWLTRVRSGSMEPTLRDGRLVLTRSLRRSTPIRRGDLVVVDHAEVVGRVLKRVVGLPGEHIGIDGGAVGVDGVPLEEPYASSSYYRGDFHVPAGHYLLLGDNRDASSDGRTWRQPYVERSAITGRLVGRCLAA